MIKTILLSPLAFLEAMFTFMAQSLAIVRCRAFLQHDYRTWLKRDLADCDSILELGCGSNSPILQIGYGKKTVGVDIFQPYVDVHNEHKDYQSCERADILSYQYLPRTFDAVVICDVFEHLDKDCVIKRKLFERMESTARKKVIIFTPNGWVENDPVDGNFAQEHKSAWEPVDYLSRGYSVKGTHGWRWIVGKAGLPKRKPISLWSIVAMLSLPVVFNHPEWAGHSYAVKVVK